MKRLDRYSKKKKDCGLVLKPTSSVCKVDTYPDANFSGMYGNEEPTDPRYIKSRIGFIITFADCPDLWVSKLQTKTTLLTMEA